MVTGETAEIQTASGSFQEESESGNDLLVDCAGGCGKKILNFFSTYTWADGVTSAMCLECVAFAISGK